MKERGKATIKVSSKKVPNHYDTLEKEGMRGLPKFKIYKYIYYFIHNGHPKENLIALVP